MKISILSKSVCNKWGVLCLGITLLSGIRADITWTFSAGSGTQGWESASMVWDSRTEGGGWDGGTTYHTPSGWASGQYAAGNDATSGALGSVGYAKMPGSVSLADYKNGKMTIRMVDDYSDPSDFVKVPEGGGSVQIGFAGTETSFPHPMESLPFVFMSGEINGQWTLLAQQMAFNNELGEYSFDLSASAWSVVDIQIRDVFGDGPGSTDTWLDVGMSSLSDEEFDLVLGTPDGLYIRTEYVIGEGSVGGTNELDYVTKIESVTLTEAAVPEPATTGVIVGMMMIGLALVGRRFR